MKEGKSEYKPCPETPDSAAEAWNKRANEQNPVNQGMKRIHIDSHFELVSGVVLPRKKIVQIWPEKVCENDAGYAVFLCEVEGPPSEE